MEEDTINPYQSPESSLSDFEIAEAGQERACPAYKLFSLWSIVVATLFGSPLAGGIVMSMNYRRIGHSDKALYAVILSVAATILVMVVAAFLPDNVPNTAIALPQLLAMIAIATTLQGKMIGTHQADGGLFSSAWIAAGIGVLCLIVLLMVIGLLAFVFAESLG